MCIFTKKFRTFDPHLPIFQDKVLKKRGYFLIPSLSVLLQIITLLIIITFISTFIIMLEIIIYQKTCQDKKYLCKFLLPTPFDIFSSIFERYFYLVSPAQSTIKIFIKRFEMSKYLVMSHISWNYKFSFSCKHMIKFR